MQDVRGKPEGRPLGRPRRRWEDNIKVAIKGLGWHGTNWIHLSQDRDQWWATANKTINLPVSYNAGNFSLRNYQLFKNDLLSEVGWFVS